MARALRRAGVLLLGQLRAGGDQPVTDSGAGPSFLDRAGGPALAYRLRTGTGPMLMFLPGYASDMDGGKAVALDAFASEKGLGLLRFDYSGTGASAGRFEDGTLGLWLEDAELMIEQLTSGPVVLIGSSMGGWLALLLAARHPRRVRALVGIAAAPDFTEWGFTDAEKSRLAAGGSLERENPYGADPQLTTAAFWKSGQDHRVLEDSVPIDCPVRLIHGERDDEVPLEVAVRTMRALRSADVQLNIIKGGGHRLSEPHEIAAILRTVDALLEPAP